MPIRVQLQDGQIAEFADGTTKEEINNIIQNSQLRSRPAEAGQPTGAAANPLGGTSGAGPTLDPSGNPIDLTRPSLDNPDGSISTENTITITDVEGRVLNIPTIIGGEQVSNEEAERMFNEGGNPAVGQFNSVGEAVAAAEARSKRIGELRSGTGPLTTDEQEQFADPFEGIPTAINGVPLNDELRGFFKAVQETDDPEQRGLLQARLAGRIEFFGEGGSIVDRAQRTQLAALIRSFGAQAFGLGDVAAAAGTLVNNDMTAGQALAAQREFRRSAEEEFPISTAIAGTAGAIVADILAFRGARGAARNTRAEGFFQRATTFSRGEGFRGGLKNAVRLGTAAGASGAVTEGVTEGAPLRGLAIGVMLGPLGVGIAGAGVVTKKMWQALIRRPEAKGLIALGRQLGETAEEMGRRFLEFRNFTGQVPLISDISNRNAALEMRQLIAKQPTAVNIADVEGRRVARTRGEEIGEQVKGARATGSRAQQRAKRTIIGDEQFEVFKSQTFIFNPRQIEQILTDPATRRGLNRGLRTRLDEVTNVPDRESIEIGGDLVNDLRIDLTRRGRGAKGQDVEFNQLADDLMAVVAPQSKEATLAVAEFAARSSRERGIAQGRRSAADRRTTEVEAEAELLTDVQTAAGVRIGARTAIVDRARESIASARTLVEDLAQNGGLVKRLRAILPKREVDELQRLGDLQARALDNLDTLAPGVAAEAGSALRAGINTVVTSMIALSGRGSGGFVVKTFENVIDKITPGLPRRTVENIARDIFDPTKTDDIIKALRKAELGEGDILDLFATVVAVSQQGTLGVDSNDDL